MGGTCAPIRSPPGISGTEYRRVYIPKPGKREKRPLGVPCVNDRALQRSTAQVLSAIYEADFLPCSFGGRPGRGADDLMMPPSSKELCVVLVFSTQRAACS